MNTKNKNVGIYSNMAETFSCKRNCELQFPIWPGRVNGKWTLDKNAKDRQACKQTCEASGATQYIDPAIYGTPGTNIGSSSSASPAPVLMQQAAPVPWGTITAVTGGVVLLGTALYFFTRK